MMRILRPRCKPNKSRAVNENVAAAAWERVQCKVHCPHCGCKGKCGRWGFYERTVIEPDPHSCGSGPSGRERRIRVQRVLCSECGRTHALLDTDIIPYRIYSLELILSALHAKQRGWTVAALCEQLQIAHSTLYRWIALFETDQMAAEIPFEMRIPWLCEWQANASIAFRQAFLLANGRSFLEHLRPSGTHIHNPQWLQWPTYDSLRTA